MAISVALVKYFLTKNLVKLNTSGSVVTETTVFKTALSTTTLGEVSNRSLFKILTRREIALNGGDGNKIWPDAWDDLTPKILASQLV